MALRDKFSALVAKLAPTPAHMTAPTHAHKESSIHAHTAVPTVELLHLSVQPLLDENASLKRQIVQMSKIMSEDHLLEVPQTQPSPHSFSTQLVKRLRIKSFTNRRGDAVILNTNTLDKFTALVATLAPTPAHITVPTHAHTESSTHAHTAVPTVEQLHLSVKQLHNENASLKHHVVELTSRCHDIASQLDNVTLQLAQFTTAPWLLDHQTTLRRGSHEQANDKIGSSHSRASPTHKHGYAHARCNWRNKKVTLQAYVLHLKRKHRENISDNPDLSFLPVPSC